MSTIDASGAIHGSDGKFKGHVSSESSVTLDDPGRFRLGPFAAQDQDGARERFDAIKDAVRQEFPSARYVVVGDTGTVGGEFVSSIHDDRGPKVWDRMDGFSADRGSFRAGLDNHVARLGRFRHGYAPDSDPDVETASYESVIDLDAAGSQSPTEPDSAEPTSDEYGPLTSDLDRDIARIFADKTTAELKRKMERAAGSTNLDDETYELSRRVRGQGKEWGWQRGANVAAKQRIVIFTPGDPGMPYHVGGPDRFPLGSGRIEYDDVRASVKDHGEQFGYRHARAVARQFSTGFGGQALRDLADGKPVLSESIKRAAYLADEKTDDDRANIALLVHWVDKQNPHPEVPQARW